MADIKVAKRYAKSLIDLSIEKGISDAVFNDMSLIRDTCVKSRDLKLLLKNPVVFPEKKYQVFKALFGDKINPLTLLFLKTVVRKRRESMLIEIADDFIITHKRNKGIEIAVVTSACGLDEKLRKEVISLVENTTKTGVELIEKIDASLIGGFILQMGDIQYDASISRSLQKISREFSSNPYIRKN